MLSPNNYRLELGARDYPAPGSLKSNYISFYNIVPPKNCFKLLFLGVISLIVVLYYRDPTKRLIICKFDSIEFRYQVFNHLDFAQIYYIRSCIYYLIAVDSTYVIVGPSPAAPTLFVASFCQFKSNFLSKVIRPELLR